MSVILQWSILVTDRDVATEKIKNEYRERKEFLYVTENGCLRKFLTCTSGPYVLLRQNITENVLISQDRMIPEDLE